MTTKKTTKTEHEVDDEAIDRMQACVRLLEPLSPEARKQVLSTLEHWFKHKPAGFEAYTT